MVVFLLSPVEGLIVHCLHLHHLLSRQYVVNLHWRVPLNIVTKRGLLTKKVFWMVALQNVYLLIDLLLILILTELILINGNIWIRLLFIVVRPFRLFVIAILNNLRFVLSLPHVRFSICKHVRLTLNDFDILHVYIYILILRFKLSLSVRFLLKAFWYHNLLVLLSSESLFIKFLLCLFVVRLRDESPFLSVVHRLHFGLRLQISIRGLPFKVLILN